jgi:hypothetical protein
MLSRLALASFLASVAACGGDAFTSSPGDASAGDAGDDGGVVADSGVDALGDATANDGGAIDGAPADGTAGDAVACLPCPLGFNCDPNGMCVDRAAHHFTIANNPSGNWSYGFITSLGTSFIRYGSTTTVESTLQVWNSGPVASSNALAPSVFSSAALVDKIYQGSFKMSPGQLGFYPGTTGEWSIIRWIAPRLGMYAIDARFTGLSGANDAAVSTTSIDLQINGAISVSKTMNTNGGPNVVVYGAPAQSFKQGDTVDFMVGYGTDGNATDDPVGADITFIAQ